MVHVPTRGDLPLRIGPGIPNTPPGYTPTTRSRTPYTDPVQFELEREKVLNRTWLIAGRSEQIPNSGDWVSLDTHGETIVVVRQPDGRAAAFHNSCVHRGPSFVYDERGEGATKFRCRYHGWSYDLDGRLVGVSERIDFDDAQLKDKRAKYVAVEEWAGWLWVNFAGHDAIPLLEWMGPEMVSELAEFRMEEMRVYDVLEFDVPVSYKAVVDGFNENYHASYLHTPSHPNWTKASRGATYHVINEHHYMHFVPRADFEAEIAVDPDHYKYAICHYVVFPNTIFNCNPQHVQLFQPIPIDVNRTRFLCWELVYQGDESDPGYAAVQARQVQHWERLKGVVAEDIEIYDQLKRVERSSGWTEQIFGVREFKIAHYHDTMARMIQE